MTQAITEFLMRSIFILGDVFFLLATLLATAIFLLMVINPNPEDEDIVSRIQIGFFGLLAAAFSIFLGLVLFHLLFKWEALHAKLSGMN